MTTIVRKRHCDADQMISYRRLRSATSPTT